MQELGKLLIGLGIIIIVVGLAFLLFGKIPGFGRLPGDILVKKENFTFYFPLATSLLISAILSVILFLWNRR